MDCHSEIVLFTFIFLKSFFNLCSYGYGHVIILEVSVEGDSVVVAS